MLFKGEFKVELEPQSNPMTRSGGSEENCDTEVSNGQTESRDDEEDDDGGGGGYGDGDNDYGTVVATAVVVPEWAGTVKKGQRPLISVPFPLHAKSLIDSINRQRRKGWGVKVLTLELSEGSLHMWWLAVWLAEWTRPKAW